MGWFFALCPLIAFGEGFFFFERKEFLSEGFIVSKSRNFRREEFAVFFCRVHVFFEAGNGFFVFFFGELFVKDAILFSV